MARFVWFLILAFGMGAFGQAPTRVVPTLSALDALKPGTTQPFVLVEGLDAGRPFAGGPKSFRWDSTNALPTNAIRRGTATGVGRWVHDWDGDVQVFGARGDGSNNDSDALNAAFLAAGDNSEVRIPDTGAAYRYSPGLVITNNNLTIHLHGKLKAVDSPTGHQIRFGDFVSFDGEGFPLTQFKNLTIKGYGKGTIDGNALTAPEYFATNGPALYGGHGFYVVGYDGVKIDGVVVSNVPLWAINIARCRNAVVQNCVVETGRGQNSARWNAKNQDGIHTIDSVDVLFTGNHVVSSDDNYAVSSISGNCKNVSIIGNIGEHITTPGPSTASASGQYAVLAYNVRVTNEGSATNYIENVLVSDNLLYGGHGCVIMNNSAHAVSNQVRRVSFRGNRFFKKDDPGVAGYLTTGIMSIGRVTDVTFDANTFDGFLGRIYIQDFHNLTFLNNEFRNQLNNTNLATKAVIFLDGVNAQHDSHNLRVEGNYFESPQGAALRVSGLKSGVAMYRDAAFNGNLVRGGPAHDFTAVQIEGVDGTVDVSGNRFEAFDNTLVDIQNSTGLNRFCDNLVLDQGSTLANRNVFFRSVTNGLLLGSVEVSGNYVHRAGGGIDVRNAERWLFDGNSLISTRLLSSQPALSWVIIGDGSGPESSNVVGDLRNNRIIGTHPTGAGSAFKAEISSAPAFSGRVTYPMGNTFQGYTTPFSSLHDTTIVPFIDYSEFRSVIGTTTPNTFGSHWRFVDATNSTGGQAFFLERANTGADTHASKNTTLNVINRVAGSGTNTTPIYGAELYASWDRASGKASFVRGTANVGRWTSSGSVGELAGIYGSVVGSGSGAADFAFAAELASPLLSGGATVASGGGLRIKPQATTGLTNAFAIRQDGTNDINAFMSPLYLGALGTNTPLVFGGTSAPTLSAANGSLYLRTDGTMYQMTNGVWTLR